MLVKNAKNRFFDAHFHFSFTSFRDNLCESDCWQGCSTAHSIEEWEKQSNCKNLVNAFGIHPQQIKPDNLDLINENFKFLEKLVTDRKIAAVGEIGFDFFTDEYKQNRDLQIVYFEKQLQLALKNNLPVIIHCRKANDVLFTYASALSRLKGVLFHSFMGSEIEAKSLIKKDINCCFSFGKQLLNNNKKVISCMTKLPIENLLCETDAPYQFLKGEACTYGDEIVRVYDTASKLRSEFSFTEYCDFMENNFRRIFS